MAYSGFSLNAVKQQFGITTDETQILFGQVLSVEIGSRLSSSLEENLPLARMLNTEKARSELVVCPVLVELRRRLNRQISLFSGIEFPVEPENGLTGTCDFLLSLSPEQYAVTAPVVAIVGGKRESIADGVGQCGNTGRRRALQSTAPKRHRGSLRLCDHGHPLEVPAPARNVLAIDLEEYHISQANHILGILFSFFARLGASAAA